MDLVALLQAKVETKHAEVHHRVQKDGHNVGYLPKEPICIPQVFGGSTTPFVGASDVVQAQISGKGLCMTQYLENIDLKRAQSIGS